MNIPTLSTVPSQSQSAQGVLAPIRRTLGWGVRTISFWLAIGIPFLYVPFVLQGFAGPNDVLTFVGLLVLNVVALVAGHDHGR